MFHKKWFPKRFLWRLTLLNIIIVSSFIVLSSLAIYNTACFLVNGMGTMNVTKQEQFNTTLFYYLWIFSILAIVVGSIVQFYVTKKLLHPLRELIESTKQMKHGRYPNPIKLNSNDEMGQLIGHFNDLVLQLKSNEDERQKLVSDLSHEFRTPLSNLNGYLNALKNGVIDGDTKLYESLHGESTRLTNMVKQLELLKEWDNVSKQIFSEKEEIDMANLIDQVVHMFHFARQKSSITLEVQAEPGYVNINSGGITQVISNLMDNAIQYYNGISPITITGTRKEYEYIVSISGPGQPIPEGEQEKIFERFYRVDTSRSRDTGGTGLGLAIAKEIIEHHGGRLGLKTNDNLHSFWFTLPLKGQIERL